MLAAAGSRLSAPPRLPSITDFVACNAGAGATAAVAAAASTHRLRASPVPGPAADGATIGHATIGHPAPVHPWSLALSSAPTRAVLEARGGATLGSANGNGGSASAPLNVRGAAASGGHSRQRSGEVRFTVPHTNGMQRSKNPSIASSMQSLDSTAVD